MIRVAFYRSKCGNWLDGAINLFSGMRGFSHTEIVFPDGSSFSSTTRDMSVDPRTGEVKKDGCRFTKIDFHPERWVFYDVPATESQIEAMRDYATSILPARYDYWGVMRFVPGIRIFAKPHPKKFWCSEACVEVLQSTGFFNDLTAWRISPNNWAKLLRIK